MYGRKQLKIRKVFMQNHNKWMSFMLFGEKLGCHQKPERSFFIKGYQMPVCARCSGVFIGYLIAIPLYLWLSISWIVALAGCGIMLFDWGIQAMTRKESTNIRRLITGIFGGYGIMSVQIKLAAIMLRSIGRRLNSH